MITITAVNLTLAAEFVSKMAAHMSTVNLTTWRQVLAGRHFPRILFRDITFSAPIYRPGIGIYWSEDASQNAGLLRITTNFVNIYFQD